MPWHARPWAPRLVGRLAPPSIPRGPRCPLVTQRPTTCPTAAPNASSRSNIEDELKSSYLRYAMSVIVDRALPDVRDGLKPSQRRILVAMNDLGLGPRREDAEVRQDRRRHVGQLPPARRERHLPDARAHGAGVQHARAARRGAGQLRLDRRRPARRHAVHGGAHDARRRWTCWTTSRRRRSTSSPTTTRRRIEPTVLPALFPNLLVNGGVGHRRRHGVVDPAAQPGRGLRRDHRRSCASPTITIAELMKHMPGPDFPTGGRICGRQAIHDAYATGPRHPRGAREVPHRDGRGRASSRSSSTRSPTRSTRRR